MSMELRAKILDLVRDYAAEQWPDLRFNRANPPFPWSGQVFDADDVVALIDSSLDFWLTAGRFHDRFERDFAAFLGTRFSLMTNSGSSSKLAGVRGPDFADARPRQLRPAMK